MFTRRLVLLIAALAAALTALVPAATAGAAAPDPERNSTKPARWHYYYGVTPAKLKSLAKSAGDRIIDLEVERTGPTKLAASLVRNSGPYARGWYWYYGKTADQIADLLDEKNARLIDLEPYMLGGKRVFAAVMVKNTGQAAKNWHWYHGVSFARVKELINEHKSRLIDLETYKQGGKKRFAVVMIRNSGVDASAWWWYVNVPLSTVQQNASQNGARTFSLDRLSNGNVNALQIKRKGEFSAYEIDMDSRRAGDFVSQNAGRIVDLDTRFAGGQRRITAIVNDNTNAANGAVRSLARKSESVKAGRFGMWVRQMGGPTLISLGADRIFEPASVLKTLHHLYVHEQLESDPNEDLSDQFTFPNCPASGQTGTCADPPKGKTSNVCPDNPAVNASTLATLDWQDRQMMAVSDNRTTAGIEQHYGRAAINAYAANVVGTENTRINHSIGCGSPANETTLVDLSRMLEGVQNGTLIQNQVLRDRFFATMTQANGVSDPLEALIQQEAGSAGKGAIVDDFVDAVDYKGKGGSYGSSVSASFGRIVLPFDSDGSKPVAFSYGHFLNCSGCTKDADLDGSYKAAAIEKFRPAVRAALKGW